MKNKELKKIRENKYRRFNSISSIWDITASMHAKGTNSNLWQNNKFEKQIQSIKKLEISANVLKKHLPKQYMDLVRLGWEWEDSIWVFFVQNNTVANKIKYLLDEISLSIAKDIGYAPRIKIQVSPNNWHLSGVSLAEKEIIQEKTPTIKEADDFIKKFVNHDD